jgi:hypothetical protein
VSLLVVAIKQNKGKEIGSGSMTEISQVLWRKLVKNGLVCIKDMAQHTKSDTKLHWWGEQSLKHKGRRWNNGFSL